MPMVRALLLMFGFATVALAGGRPVGHPPTTSPTFAGDIVRIFQDRCQECHRPAGIAPFSLVDYESAAAHVDAIRYMVSGRFMPPWKAAPDCGDFLGSRRLSDAELETIVGWIDGGALPGNPDDAPPPREFPEQWAMGEPDLVLELPEYTPPMGDDEYRCFPVKTEGSDKRWVSMTDVMPGNRSIVHHVLAFIDGAGLSAALDADDPLPGYPCFGGPGFTPTGALGGWAPGITATELPTGVGIELPANASVVLQIHYHPHHETGPDRSRMGLYFATSEVEKPLYYLPLANTTFTIPPGEANYQVTASFLSPLPFEILNIAPHMHLLGKSMRVEATIPGQEAICLVDVPAWDFNWQSIYRYREPVALPAGTRLKLTAVFDNSESNPRNPNSPPQAVSWGEQTTDEMCLVFFGVTLGGGVAGEEFADRE